MSSRTLAAEQPHQAAEKPTGAIFCSAGKDSGARLYRRSGRRFWGREMKVVNNVTVAPEFAISAFITGAAVTPSDSAQLGDATHGLYVGGGGDVTVVFAEDATLTAVTFKAVPVGVILPISVIQVRATGTTATNVVALY